jgi:hypothetical protein
MLPLLPAALLPPPSPAPAEAARLEAEVQELRGQQKRLLALLADKGVTAQGLEDGMLRAMLHLKG